MRRGRARKSGPFAVIDIPGDGAEVVNRVSLLGPRLCRWAVDGVATGSDARLPRAFAAVTTFAEAQPDVRRYSSGHLGERAPTPCLLWEQPSPSRSVKPRR